MNVQETKEQLIAVLIGLALLYVAFRLRKWGRAS